MNTVFTFIKNNTVLCWIIGFQFFRFLLLPFMGLMPQDAYYYFYGQNLSLSYFDHPGMIGYQLRLFSEVFGHSVFVVKFSDFIITSLTIYSFYRLALKFTSKSSASIATLLLTSTLFISILSFNSTPDVPLLLFWTLSVLFLYKAIFENNKWYWVLGGIAMGLAFDSKYTALLLQFGVLAFLAFSNQYRKLLISPWLWLSLVISALITAPVWIWNYENDFVSFLFQSTNRTGSISEFKVSPKYFLGAIGHQIFLLLPILFGVFWFFIYKYVKRAFTKMKLPSTKILFLLAFFIPTFVGFFCLTPIYWVKLNWMMPSYITGIIIAAFFITKKMIKYQLGFSVIIHILLATQVLFYIVPVKSDDTWVGWEELHKETLILKEKYPDAFIFADDNYKTSACLNFFSEEKIYAQNIIGKHALHFDYLGDNLNLLNGKNALLIDSDKRFKNANKKKETEPLLDRYFEKVTQLEPILIEINGKETRKFWVFYCENYHFKD